MKPQPADQRRYRSLRVTEDLRIGGDEDNLNIYNPIDVVANKEGVIYVLDEGSYQVKQFDGDGRLLQTFGTGRGEGPGEFTQPVDFAVRDNGEVLVLDYGRRQVTLFLADGSLLGHHGVEGSPVQLVAGADEHSVHFTTREHLFHIFKADGSERRSFGRFIEEQERKGVAVQGTLARDEDILYYVGFWSGHLVALTPEGDIRFARTSIDRLQIPGFTHSDRLDVTALDNEGYPVHPMLVRVENMLYTAVVPSGEGRLVIDVYDAADGTY